MQNISRLFKQVINYPTRTINVYQYCAYLYIAEKQIWQLLQALGNSTKLEMLLKFVQRSN